MRKKKLFLYKVMSSKEELATVVNRLRQAIKSKIPIFIQRDSTRINRLLRVLKQEKTVILMKVYSSTQLVKVAHGVTDIELLTTGINVKAKQLATWAKKMLNNNNGWLLISTTQGLMSHREAEKKHLGGKVIGMVQ